MRNKNCPSPKKNGKRACSTDGGEKKKKSVSNTFKKNCRGARFYVKQRGKKRRKKSTPAITRQWGGVANKSGKKNTKKDPPTTVLTDKWGPDEKGPGTASTERSDSGGGVVTRSTKEKGAGKIFGHKGGANNSQEMSWSKRKGIGHRVVPIIKGCAKGEGTAGL